MPQQSEALMKRGDWRSVVKLQTVDRHNRKGARKDALILLLRRKDGGYSFLPP